jgi:hypothetical protein
VKWKVKKSLKIIIMDAFLYVVQFILIPGGYANVFGHNNEGTIVLFITTVLHMLIGLISLSYVFRYWLISYIFYVALIILYTPPGIYGIGLVGLSLDGMNSHYEASERFLGILVVCTFVLLIKFASWVFYGAIALLMGRGRNKSK